MYICIYIYIVENMFSNTTYVCICIYICTYIYIYVYSGEHLYTYIHVLQYFYMLYVYIVETRGGGLGSSTIFKKFNEPYAPS